MSEDPKPTTLREWARTTTPPYTVVGATAIGYAVIAAVLGQKLWALLLG